MTTRRAMAKGVGAMILAKAVPSMEMEAASKKEEEKVNYSRHVHKFLKPLFCDRGMQCFMCGGFGHKAADCKKKNARFIRCRRHISLLILMYTCIVRRRDGNYDSYSQNKKFKKFD